MGPWTVKSARKVLNQPYDHQEDKLIKAMILLDKKNSLNNVDLSNIKSLFELQSSYSLRKAAASIIIKSSDVDAGIYRYIMNKLTSIISGLKNKKNDDDSYIYGFFPKALSYVKKGFDFEVEYEEEVKVVDDTPYLVDVTHDMGGYTATYSDGSTESGVGTDWGNPFGSPDNSGEPRYKVKSPEKIDVVQGNTIEI